MRMTFPSAPMAGPAHASQKAVRRLTYTVVDYTVSAGLWRGPVPDRCAHQAGTSPLLHNHVSYLLW